MKTRIRQLAILQIATLNAWIAIIALTIATMMIATIYHILVLGHQQQRLKECY